MDFIKEWTLTISTSLIISIIFSVLAPKGNMGRFFKIVLAMFIFVTFIYPIKNADFNFDLPDFSVYDAADEQSRAYEKMVNKSIENLLSDGGYLSSGVDSEIRCDGEELEFIYLRIGIDDEFDKDEVKKYVFDNMGLNAEVYYLGE